MLGLWCCFTIDFSSLLTKKTIGLYNNCIHNPKLHLYSAQGVMHFYVTFSLGLRQLALAVQLSAFIL